MKTLNVLMLALITICALPNLASAKDLRGTYQRKAVVRFSGTAEFCKESEGEYVEEEKACYIAQEDGNSITIGDNLVHVETLYGAANMRDFDGVIINISGNVVTARESLIEDGQMKDACVMKIEISEEGLATTIPGEECDSHLTIVNAKRK